MHQRQTHYLRKYRPSKDKLVSTRMTTAFGRNVAVAEVAAGAEGVAAVAGTEAWVMLYGTTVGVELGSAILVLVVVYVLVVVGSFPIRPYCKPYAAVSQK